MHLADRLGDDYVVLGTTTGPGRTLNTGPDFYQGVLFTDLGAPEPDTLDALLAASHDGPFAVDLRHLSPADAAAVGAVTRQRFGTVHVPQRPLDAYDVVVHLPHVTPAEPDQDALTYAPAEVREAFARWRPA
jgi:erythromycin esterase